MRTMCPTGYHHNGFVATHALGHMMYGYMYIYVCMYMHVCVYIYICVCMWELTINGGLDISGVLSFASIRHRKTIIFDRQKTLYLKEAPAKLLKTYLKNNGSICFVDMDFNLIKLLLEIKSSFSSRKISP